MHHASSYLIYIYQLVMVMDIVNGSIDSSKTPSIHPYIIILISLTRLSFSSLLFSSFSLPLGVEDENLWSSTGVEE
ncbi:hypothetical protein RIF29_17974 [Crotalaria pallida]|uniref:Uncharacterized protein n=1 Tax=Crotalaria pallida TaxID=3830 RepID=A0AAN9FRU6_CROPI